MPPNDPSSGTPDDGGQGGEGTEEMKTEPTTGVACSAWLGGIVSSFVLGPLRSSYSPDGYSKHETEGNIPECCAEH